MSMQACCLPPHQRVQACAADLEGKACCNSISGTRHRPQQAAAAGIPAAQCRGSAASHHQPGVSPLQASSLLCSKMLPVPCSHLAACHAQPCHKHAGPQQPPQHRSAAGCCCPTAGGRPCSGSGSRHGVVSDLTLQVSNLHCCRGCSLAQPPAQAKLCGCCLVSTLLVHCIGWGSMQCQWIGTTPAYKGISTLSVPAASYNSWTPSCASSVGVLVQGQ